ncbi:MAG: cobalt-precorrin-5B (C(1))-methyltransferase CbiD [Candidatus Anammoxibacter sp.]
MLKSQHLREGYTTGTCAAAAAKGAAFGLISGNIPDYVTIKTPIGKTVKLKILEKKINGNFAECCVRKDAGDDPDVTHGALIYCGLRIIDCGVRNADCGLENDNEQKFNNHKVQESAFRDPHSTIEIVGGEGVGVVTKPGLQVEVGQAAINPVPMQMIRDAINDVVKKSEHNFMATISVPDGCEIAKRTFNERLGICGGISIIGTTGFVRPMSEESIKTSLKCELDIAKAVGFKTVVLVPGNLAETAVKKTFKLKNAQVVLMSNFVGFMLKAAHDHGFKKIILAGHPGKLAKLIRGDFNTHNSKSKQANDIIVNLVENETFEKNTVNSIRKSTTVEGIIQEVKKAGKLDFFNKIAKMIEIAASDFLENKQKIGVVLFDIKKQIIGISLDATRMKDVL